MLFPVVSVEETLTFIETPAFTRKCEQQTYFSDDDDFRAFQNALMENPTAGEVIPGTSGIRKVRWEDRERGKGKRGGLRIWYYYLIEAKTILLLAVYDKDLASDLSAEQKKTLRELVQTLRKEVT